MELLLSSSVVGYVFFFLCALICAITATIIIISTSTSIVVVHASRCRLHCWYFIMLLLLTLCHKFVILHTSMACNMQGGSLVSLEHVCFLATLIECGWRYFVVASL